MATCLLQAGGFEFHPETIFARLMNHGGANETMVNMVADHTQHSRGRRLYVGGFLNEHGWFVSFCHLAMFFEMIAFAQHTLWRLRVCEVGANVILFIFVVVAHGDPHDSWWWLTKDCHALWAVLHIFICAWGIIQEQLHQSSLMNELTPEDKIVRETYFSHYSSPQFAEIQRKYKWKNCSVGDYLMKQGENTHKLYMVYKGTADITVRAANDPVIRARLNQLNYPKSYASFGESTTKENESRVASSPHSPQGTLYEANSLKADKQSQKQQHALGCESGETLVGTVVSGQYIGEMAYFTREAASASVKASKVMTLIEWDIEEVRHLATHAGHSVQSEAFGMLPALFCRDMANKLANATTEKLEQTRDPAKVAPDGLYSSDSLHGNFHRRISRML